MYYFLKSELLPEERDNSKIVEMVERHSRKKDDYEKIINQRILEFVGGNKMVFGKQGGLFPALFIIMVGLGVADVKEEHIHNIKLRDFLKDSSPDIYEEFMKFWKNPIASKIRYESAGKIYKAYNSMFFPNVIKLISARISPVLITSEKDFKRLKAKEKLELQSAKAEELNWSEWFLKLRVE